MHQRRILIVDDDAIFLGLLQIFIDCLLPECQIVTVGDGATALTELQQQPFDLILTDYDIPGMNGLDLIQAIRQISADIPIVLMTGRYNGYREIETRASSANLAGFLSKPFAFLQLKDILQQNGL